MPDTRQLSDLSGVGRATLQDFSRLGIPGVEALGRCEALELYERICALDGQAHDICALDVFACAIAQARNPQLPIEQRNWWWWSRQRKGQGASTKRGENANEWRGDGGEP